MRRVRKKVLRHAKLKLYAVDACFLVLAVTATAKMNGITFKTAVSEHVYAAATEEELQAGEIMAQEPISVPYGYTEPTGYDIPSEEVEAHATVETESTESLIKSRDWDEGDVLMQIAMAEAEGESVEGKALVMLVVLNRVWSEGFPDGISEVVFEPGQFTPVENGRYYDVVPDEGCREAYQMVCQGWDESQGALYFASTDFPHTWHTNNCEYLFTVGKHDFFK